MDRTILLVDDDPRQRAAVADLLSHRGYEVVLACDGQDALELLATGVRPSLIVLDLSMPRMDGWSFLEHLRGTQRSSVPVLVTSGDARERPPIGADAWVEKPVDVAAFSALVARLSAVEGAGQSTSSTSSPIARARTASPPGAGLAVQDGQHVCLLYEDDDERDRVLAQFFSTAVSQQQRTVYITDSGSPDEIAQRLERGGVGPRAGQARGVLTTREAYFPDGRFRPEAMCRVLEGLCREALGAGFAGVRCTGEMQWALRGVPGAERLLDYEEMLTGVMERLPSSAVCQYDVRRFDRLTILGIRAMHPYLLVHGQVVANPDYVGVVERRESPVH